MLIFYVMMILAGGITGFVAPADTSLDPAGHGRSGVAAETVIRVDLAACGGNAVVAVRRALEQARKVTGQGKTVRVVFPEGRYDFLPDSCERRQYFESNTYVTDYRLCAIVLDKMDHLILDGRGSEFIFHGPMQPVTVDSCHDILLKDFSIDWEVPLTSQAQVVATTDQYIDIRISGESPYVIRDGKLFFRVGDRESRWWGTIEFAKDSHLIPEGSGDRCLGDKWQKYRAEEIAPGLVRLHYPFGRRPAVGNYLVMRHNRREANMPACSSSTAGISPWRISTCTIPPDWGCSVSFPGISVLSGCMWCRTLERTGIFPVMMTASTSPTAGGRWRSATVLSAD